MKTLEEELAELTGEEVDIVTASDIVNYVDKIYPNRMVLEEMSDFERGKLAGKIELITAMKHIIEN